MVHEFYKSLYTSEGVSYMDTILKNVPSKVTSEMNDMQVSPYTLEEDKNALFLCDTLVFGLLA